MYIYSFPSILYWRGSLFSSVYFCQKSLSKLRCLLAEWVFIWVLYFNPSVPFCQYPADFAVMCLYRSMNSGTAIPLALFFLLRVGLASWSHLGFQMGFYDCSFLFVWRMALEFWWWLHWIWTLLWVAWSTFFHNVNFSDPWARNLFPSCVTLFAPLVSSNFHCSCLSLP